MKWATYKQRNVAAINLFTNDELKTTELKRIGRRKRKNKKRNCGECDHVKYYVVTFVERGRV
jgi:hypothetical protein